MVGDFNHPGISWEDGIANGEDDYNFLETVRDCFLTQHVSTPTRGRGAQIPSVLDLVLTSVDDAIEFIDVGAPLGSSDHATIVFGYRCRPAELAVKVTYMYNKADYSKMREHLQVDWEEAFRDCPNDVDKQWNIFIEKYEEAERLWVPRKVFRKGNKKYSVPLDRKTLAKKRKKYRLWQRYTETEDGKIYAEYCRCSNQLRRLTRKATKLFEKNIANQSKQNPKAFWNYVSTKTKMR